MFVFYYSVKVSLLYHSGEIKNDVESQSVCVSEYLTSCLDAENGHPCLWVTLELVDQLDSLRGRDAAIDADISSLE